MNESVRIGLRLVGLVFVMAGVGLAVAFVVAGPSEVAGWVGKSCNDRATLLAMSDEACGFKDMVEYLPVVPILIIAGLAMVLALRPPTQPGEVQAAGGDVRPSLFQRGVVRLFAGR